MVEPCVRKVLFKRVTGVFSENMRKVVSVEIELIRKTFDSDIVHISFVEDLFDVGHEFYMFCLIGFERETVNFDKKLNNAVIESCFPQYPSIDVFFVYFVDNNANESVSRAVDDV